MRQIHVVSGLLPLLFACGTDTPTTPLGTAARDVALAKGGGGSPTLYKLRFITGVNPAGDGEMTSDWFPAAGISINTRDPWKSVSAVGTLNLVNYTHGTQTVGACGSYTASIPINWTNWDIAGTSLSYAGSWLGTVSVSSAPGGTNHFYFDGDRVGGGGGIHNIASNNNATVKTIGPNNDWFRIEYRNTLLKFGSASSADGVNNPYGVEVACTNFTIEARKVSLITP